MNASGSAAPKPQPLVWLDQWTRRRIGTDVTFTRAVQTATTRRGPVDPLFEIWTVRTAPRSLRLA